MKESTYSHPTDIERGDLVTHTVFPPVEGRVISITTGTRPLLTVMRPDESVFSDVLDNWMVLEKNSTIEIE